MKNRLVQTAFLIGSSILGSAAFAGYPPSDEMLCYENCAQTHSHEYCLAECYSGSSSEWRDGKTEFLVKPLSCQTVSKVRALNAI